MDIHSHLLPGIDDGAATMEDSLALIRQLKELGYKKLVTTPHIYSAFYPNTKTGILEKRDEVRRAMAAEGIDMELDAAAEYFMDEHFETLLLGEEPLLCIQERQVLVEMSFFGAPPSLESYLFRLRSKGYQPVLAHPERYGFLHPQKEYYSRLQELGCLFQVNILSLAGYYKRPVQEAAEYLLRKEMIHFLGTDLHHQRHLDALRDALTHKKTREALAFVSGGLPVES